MKLRKSKEQIKPVAVCEVDIEQFKNVHIRLKNYEQAFIIFRFKGAVVGQAWTKVNNGEVSAADLDESIKTTAWAIWKYLACQNKNAPWSPTTASIVICTRDRTADLSQCLPELLHLTKEGHEIIVVDNCPSNDSTARLVARYPQIHYILEPRPGAGTARNRGILAATKEFIAFTDDDARVDSSWLPALLRNFNDPMVAVVLGITMPLELETRAQIWFEWKDGFGRGFLRSEHDINNINPLIAGKLGASVNMAVRRSALKEIGLFDEALGPGTIALCGEDHEFFYRTLARGFRIVYEPSALVRHRHRRKWKALRKTIHSYGVGVFAWWTRALLVEKEFSVIYFGFRWFLQYHVRNLIQCLLRRPGRIPLDLAWIEFHGALAGPFRYWRSRNQVKKRKKSINDEKSIINVADQHGEMNITNSNQMNCGLSTTDLNVEVE